MPPHPQAAALYLSDPVTFQLSVNGTLSSRLRFVDVQCTPTDRRGAERCEGSGEMEIAV